MGSWSPLSAIKLPPEGEEATMPPCEAMPPAAGSHAFGHDSEASVFTDCSLQVEKCTFADHMHSDQFNVVSTLKWVEFSVVLKDSHDAVVSPKLTIPLVASLEYESGFAVPIVGIMGNLVGEATGTLHDGRCKFKVKPMTGVTSALRQNRAFRLVVQPSDPALHCWSLKAFSPAFRILVKTSRRDASGRVKGPRVPEGLAPPEPPKPTKAPKPTEAPSAPPAPKEDPIVSEVNEIVQRGAIEISSLVAGVMHRLGVAEVGLKKLKKENAALLAEVAMLRNTVAAGLDAPVVGEASPMRKRTRASH